MLRQTGEPQLDSDGILSRGTLVRHLVLPGAGKNTRGVIDMLAQLPQDFIFSLMAQYTPIPGIEIEYPELGRRITQQGVRSRSGISRAVGHRKLLSSGA